MCHPSLTEQQHGVEWSMSDKVRRLTQNSRTVEVPVLSHRRPSYSVSNEEEGVKREKRKRKKRKRKRRKRRKKRERKWRRWMECV